MRLGQICWVRLVQKLFSHKVRCSISTLTMELCIDWARLRWDLTRAVIASRGRKLIEARKTASDQFRLDDDKTINNLFSLHEQFFLHESSGNFSLSISPIARYAVKSNLEMKWALSSTYLLILILTYPHPYLSSSGPWGLLVIKFIQLKTKLEWNQSDMI